MPTTLARRTLVAGALLGAVLTGSTAPAQNFQPARAVVTADQNAALRYWRAFAMMDENLRNLLGADAATLTDPTFEASPELRKAVADASSVIDQLTLGASMAQCDFGVDRNLGVGALLPQLQPMRSAARLLLVDARLQIEAGDSRTAAERIATALRMADHAAQDGFVICSLVSVAMFSGVRSVTEQLLDQGAFSAEDRAVLRDALAMFPAGDPFRAEAAIRGEADSITDWVRATLKEADGRETLTRALDDGSSPSFRTAALDALEQATLQSHADLLRVAYAQLLAAWNAPDPEAALAKLGEEVDAGAFGSFARTLLPALDRFRRNVTQANAEFDAFRDRLAE
jgi:hypothetical protein